MIQLDGEPVFFRRAEDDGTPVVYLHSAPTSCDDWAAFLPRTGGLAVDLPGFGRSGKGGHLEYTLPAYVGFLERWLEALEVGELALAGHGWGGAIALAFAQRDPDRVRRLALLDAVPLLEGYHWPAAVRRLRTPLLGELIIGSVTKSMLARVLRGATVRPFAFDQARLDAIWAQFDQGTQRAILRLTRSIDPVGLAAAGLELDHVAMPTLVVTGERDPWVPPAFAQTCAQRLPDAELESVADAGHWPWLDVPGVVERVSAFLNAA